MNNNNKKLNNEYSRRRAQRPRSISQTTRAAVLYAVILIAIFTSVVAWCDQNRNNDFEPVNSPLDSLMIVELPDGQAAQDIRYLGFKVSFNSTHHQPNYVAWELTPEKVNGDEPRRSNFAADENVEGCATLQDYRGSGFDRGHMAPAADMKWSSVAMDQSHLLTNICPQVHSINAGQWNSLEQATRRWALRDSQLVIIAGPVLSDRMPRTIGPSGVTVPERFFKIILAPNANPPRAIGFIVPNAPVHDQLESMVYTVDEIEEITGYDFFSSLPDNLENNIESSADFRTWARPRNR